MGVRIKQHTFIGVKFTNVKFGDNYRIELNSKEYVDDSLDNLGELIVQDINFNSGQPSLKWLENVDNQYLIIGFDLGRDFNADYVIMKEGFVEFTGLDMMYRVLKNLGIGHSGNIGIHFEWTIG